ncbi:hypothetical protein ACWIWK_01740 [Helicobacter sp. 23-1048]
MSATDNFYFLQNNLFTQYALRVDFVRDFPALKDDAQDAFEAIASLYDAHKFANQNEHQFEDSFIAEVAQILGYHFIRQEEKIIQGKLEIFCSLPRMRTKRRMSLSQKTPAKPQMSISRSF